MKALERVNGAKVDKLTFDKTTFIESIGMNVHLHIVLVANIERLPND